MIKYLLTLYVTINGVCTPDRVYMWGDGREINIEASTFEIHAKATNDITTQEQYHIYTDGVYYYGVRWDWGEGFTLSIYVFQLLNKRVVPIKGILMTNQECTGVREE